MLGKEMNVWSSTVWLSQARFCNLWGTRQIRTTEPAVHWQYAWENLGFGNVTLCPNTVYIELNNSLISQARCRRAHRTTWFKRSQVMGIQHQIQSCAVWAELFPLSSLVQSSWRETWEQCQDRGLVPGAWTSCGAMVSDGSAVFGCQLSTCTDGWSRIQKLDSPWG